MGEDDDELTIDCPNILGATPDSIIVPAKHSVRGTDCVVHVPRQMYHTMIDEYADDRSAGLGHSRIFLHGLTARAEPAHLRNVETDELTDVPAFDASEYIIDGSTDEE